MTNQKVVIEITPEQALEMIKEGAILLDTRDPREFSLSHPENAQNLTNANYNRIMDDVDFDEPVIIICKIGKSSLQAGAYLIEQGYEEVYSIKGGFVAWQNNSLPVENQ